MAENTSRRAERSALQLSSFFSNLGLVYHSGISLAEGFEILKLSAKDKDEEAMMDEMVAAVQGGSSLSTTLEAVGGVPPYALNLLRIGEETGRMEETCASLSDYYERRDQLEHSIRSSLVYPLSMLVMVFVVVLVLLTQAMPVFEQVFAQLGFTMNGFSSVLLAAGQALNQAALVIGAVLVALIIIGIVLWISPSGKKLFKRLFDSFPLTKDLSHRLSAQRLALALSTMFHSGLDTDQAFDLALPLIENTTAKTEIRTIQEQLQKGESLQNAIRTSRLFPTDARATLSMGFRTGTDAQAFDEIGKSLLLTTERKIESLVATIEPTLVAIMCVLVGIILFSVMLPLLGVLTSL
ncbi:MAG: type II secretion system F family protein [Coriobacteriales bacterium]|jgi:type IV pilus assembly protein PilC|nr:type II secretion system F family protein [Coriobacteriales bacterium]